MDYLGLEVHSRVAVTAEHHNPRWRKPDRDRPGGNFFDNGLADADGADPKASLHWYHDVISRRGLV
jgi:hypothetical protein